MDPKAKTNPKITWPQFIDELKAFDEVTLIGPFAAPRKEWPYPAIFVDAGSRHQGPHKLHISVGDGDSSPGPVDHLLPAEKDYSDLAFVLEGLPDNVRRLSMVGFMGGRKDHELLNLGEIQRFLKRCSLPTECDLDFSVCGFSAGLWPLELKGIFSLVAFTDINVTMVGHCRYQISEPQALSALSSRGLSNEANGVVEILSNGPFFIFKNPFS